MANPTPTIEHVWAESRARYGLSYADLVRTMGVEIVSEKEFGSYQGDLVYHVRRGDTLGILVCGYGSCSGYDALQAAEGYSDNLTEGVLRDLTALRDQLQAEILWPSPGQTLAERVAEKIAADPYWAYDSEVKEHVVKLAPEQAETPEADDARQ